jgi:serine/threonine protein kinase
MIDAVEELHSFGFLNSNIKPESFRIRDHRVYLLDYGSVIP